MQVLEFWPEYGAGPLWTQDGKLVDLVELELGEDLTLRVGEWNARFTETMVPVDGPGDGAWLREGRGLLSQIRELLSGKYRVVVTETWWGERPWWAATRSDGSRLGRPIVPGLTA